MTNVLRALIFAALGIAGTAAAQAPAGDCPALLDHSFRKLQGGQVRSLCEYRGKVLLVVNTASYCGYTKQYEGLEALYRKYRDRGLVVVGFPSNDFGGQEPGSNQDIKTFCSTKFGVTFPLFAKIAVKGPTKHPLYAMLVETPPAGEVKWNFGKFLVGKDGKVIARYDSKTTPDAPDLAAAIEKALGS